MKDIKTIGITGSSGFVGTRLSKRLAAEEVEIVEIDLQKGIDVTDWDTVKNIREIDVLVHLAAYISVPDSVKDPRPFLSKNISGTLNMLEICRLCNATMIFASSSLVYGPPQYIPVDEIHPLEGTNPYAISKLLGEELCKGYHRTFGLKTVIVRAFNIYGPSQSSGSLISSITKQAKQGRIVLRDPSPKRDYVYVDDVVEAYAKLCFYDADDFDVFNIGTGESYSVQEIADTVVETLDRPAEVIFTHQKRMNEIDDIRADISYATTRLGWNPKISLKAGIDRVLDAQ